MFRIRLLHTTLAMTFIGAIALSGCGGDDGPASAEVTLSEWIVEASPSEVGVGEVKLTATNPGSTDHEMLVYRGTAEELPLKENGSVDEDALGDDVIGEIGDMAPGLTKSKTFNLDVAGEYTLFCNIEQETADGEVVHYAKGMVTSLTVTE